MAFRESSRLFGRTLTPEAAERTNSLMPRWTSSSGYCIPTAMTAKAPPRLERWQGHRNGHHANRTLNFKRGRNVSRFHITGGNLIGVSKRVRRHQLTVG